MLDCTEAGIVFAGVKGGRGRGWGAERRFVLAAESLKVIVKNTNTHMPDRTRLKEVGANQTG